MTIHPNLLNINRECEYETYTYTVKADNGQHKPRIEFSHDAVAGHQAKAVALLLTKAFRNVEVLCNETGEVMFHNYVACEWFEPDLEISTVLSVVEDKLDD